MTNMVPIPGTNKVGHPDLARVWPVFTRYCLNHGKPAPRLLQAYGFAKASANTHGDGLAADWDLTDTWYSLAWRKITGGPAWPRLWPGNYHSHGLLPHSISAAYQVRAWRLGFDGTGWMGMKARDTLGNRQIVARPFTHYLAPYERDLLVDGMLGSATVGRLREYLVRRGYTLDDKSWECTWRTFGRFLAANGHMAKSRTAEPDAVTRAFQRWQGQYVDGVLGPASVRALQRWLNTVM